MAVYKLTAFPRALQVTSGPPITVRPMQPTDTAALLEFFRGIPDEERYFLKDDVASDAVIES